MPIRGVASPRIARLTQIALAMLICTTLGACHAPDSTSTGSATSNAASSDTTSSTADPTVKSITLSWSPPTQNSDGTALTNLAGYTLHYGTTPEDYTGSIEITNPTATSYVVSDSNFPAGTYYFAISAYNAQQVSSSMSGEVAVTLD
jgi:hypothetical protein